VLNRLATATDNRLAAQGGPSVPTTYSYDAAGNLSGHVYANSLQTGNVFDPLNRLTQTCVATSSPACTASQKLASYAYTLGAAPEPWRRHTQKLAQMHVLFSLITRRPRKPHRTQS